MDTDATDGSATDGALQRGMSFGAGVLAVIRGPRRNLCRKCADPIGSHGSRQQTRGIAALTAFAEGLLGRAQNR